MPDHMAGVLEQRIPVDPHHGQDRRRQERSFVPEDLSEFETRKIYIDVDMKLMGWRFTGADRDVQEEYPVEGMPNGAQAGAADYVLFGKDGLPLAVVEAKRTSKDPNTGRKQAPSGRSAVFSARTTCKS